MMQLGLPAAGMLLFESSAFAAAGIMNGWLGAVPLAAPSCQVMLVATESVRDSPPMVALRLVSVSSESAMCASNLSFGKRLLSWDAAPLVSHASKSG